MDKPRFEIEMTEGDYLVIVTKKKGLFLDKFVLKVIEHGQITVERELRNYG